jgi:hypothetical protein
MGNNSTIPTTNPTPPPTTRPGNTPKKVWTTLITNTTYLPGLLTLDASLKLVQSAYPLVALYTDTFPAAGHAALDARGIPKKRIPYLLPSLRKDYTHDPRFYDCWSKLTPFGLTEYERVVQLDSDMLVRQNMDELMDVPLDDPADGGGGGAGTGPRVFAASHACVCNPLRKPHYPRDWVPGNCAFTTQHGTPEAAQEEGAAAAAGLGMPNGGLQVVVPSRELYDMILKRLEDPTIMEYDFADQSLLGDLFRGRWVALPYTYNALKTLRWEGVHDAIWRDERVKNVHYIMSPKPWDETDEDKRKEGRDPLHQWWWDINEKRLQGEREKGIDDGF